MNPTAEPTCVWCREAILSQHAQSFHMYANGAQAHRECAQRSVVGGVNHQRGTCTCCGGTDDPDPPELSRREAAIAAAYYWEAIDRAADVLARNHPSMTSLEWLATLMPERGGE